MVINFIRKNLKKINVVIFNKEKSGNFTLKVFVEAYFTLIHKINKDEALENVLMVRVN